MYAAVLSTDFWQAVRCDASDIAHPSPEDIEAAIKALDGMHRTTVTIRGNDEATWRWAAGRAVNMLFMQHSITRVFLC
jgi:hypothetical protein